MRLPSTRQIEQSESFQRLLRTLCHGPDFQLVFGECPHEGLAQRTRKCLDQALTESQLTIARVDLESTPPTDASSLENVLSQACQRGAIIHVLGLSAWSSPDAITPYSHLSSFNARREQLARTCRARLVFWLTPEAVVRLAREAPDLWAWRSGLYTFEARAMTLPKRKYLVPTTFDTRSNREKQRRIQTLEQALQDHGDMAAEIQAQLLEELADLCVQTNKPHKALRAMEKALTLLNEGKDSSAQTRLQEKITLLRQNSPTPSL